jgi:hypothetical protein
MTAMADMIALTDGPEMDDGEVRRRLLKQCLSFAFNPELHPDTCMSASQMWAKLKEQTKARDLGPGNPLTLEAAVERHRDIDAACGPEITALGCAAAFTGEAGLAFLSRLMAAFSADMVLAALKTVFTVKDEEAPGGSTQDQQAAPAGGATEAPRPA